MRSTKEMIVTGGVWTLRGPSVYNFGADNSSVQVKKSKIIPVEISLNVRCSKYAIPDNISNIFAPVQQLF